MSKSQAWADLANQPDDTIPRPEWLPPTPVPSIDHEAEAQDLRPPPLALASARRELRYIVPSREMIRNALTKNGIIAPNCITVPDSYEHESGAVRYRADLWRAQHDNPRGINCPDASVCDLSLCCQKPMIECNHAKIVTIIYELAEHDVSQRSVSRIEVKSFMNVYGEDCAIKAPWSWFDIYALYINSCAHLRDVNHVCDATCNICDMRSMRNCVPRGAAGDADNAAIIAHICKWKHYPSAGRGMMKRDARSRCANAGANAGAFPPAMAGVGAFANRARRREGAGHGAPPTIASVIADRCSPSISDVLAGK